MGFDIPQTCVVGYLAIDFAISSERPDDLDILVVDPQGRKSLIISDAGGNDTMTWNGYLFRLGGTTPFPDESAPPVGYYLGANYAGLPSLEPDGVDTFPSAGGTAQYTVDFGSFTGGGFINYGPWKLYVVDDETGNLSSLPQGWRISVYSLCSQPGGCVPTPTPSPPPTVTPTPIEVCAPGALDFSFGSTGFAQTNLGGDDSGSAIAVQPDEKIVVAGSRFDGPLLDVALVRYNADGTLDTSFGTGGRVVTQVSSNQDFASAVKISPDGKVLVAGGASIASNYDFVIVRYNADGTLDSTFGDDGIVTTGLGASSDTAQDLVLQPDGKIVAAGQMWNGSNSDFALARYNTDGSLDWSFGNLGKVITPVGTGNDRIESVILQPDGKLLAAGRSAVGQGDDFSVVRYNANGTLDTSFGTGGKVITPIGSADSANSIVLQNDGKIVAAGHAGMASVDFAMVRYNTDGTLDESFGLGGIVTTPVGISADYGYSVMLQPDGRLVVVGSGTGELLDSFALVRYEPDGSLDKTFGSDGKVVVRVGNAPTTGYAGALQSDGKILVAGHMRLGALNGDMVVARYLSTGVCYTPTPTPTSTPTPTPTPSSSPTPSCAGALDVTFDEDGKVTTPVQSSTDVATSSAVQADGKIVVAGTSYTGTDPNFAVVRYNRDGSLDTSFDGDGKVITRVLGNSDSADAVAIAPDGKIVVAGSASYPATNPDFAIVRYNQDGSLDATFDGDGKAIVDVSSFPARAYAVAIYPDGRIVAAGTAHNGESYNFAVVRLNVNGSPDTTFSNDGKVMTEIAAGDIAYSIAIGTDGRIAVGGTTFNYSNYDFAAVRYLADGRLDSSFGTGGIVKVGVLNDDDTGRSIAVLPDGKVVLAGYAQNLFASRDEFAVVRLRSNGLPDPTFSGDGKLTTTFFDRDDRAQAIAIQPDGKIVAAGYSHNGLNNDFAIARYNPDGSLDAAFDGDGKTTTPILVSESANAVTITPNGRIVATGNASGVPTNGDFAAVRYLAAPCGTAPRASFDYDGDARTDFSAFRPSNGNWYLQRSTAGYQGVQFGNDSDRLAPADYDGDGKTDVAVYQPADGRWYILRSATGTIDYQSFGAAEDVPVPADYDGDGRADLTVFRPSQGAWYRKNSSNGLFYALQFGINGDIPTIGDFDGDGESDIGIWRPSNGDWYNIRSGNGSVFGERFGQTGDKIAPADYDGDGKTDIAIFRPSTGLWVVRNSATATYSYHGLWSLQRCSDLG